jgi:protein SCO1/2
MNTHRDIANFVSRPMRAAAVGLSLLGAGLLLPAGEAWSQSRVPPAGEIGATPVPPPAEVNEVAIQQNIGTQLPLDTRLMDQNGKPVLLGDYFDGKRPVLIEFVYFDCPMLCPLMTSGIAEATGQVDGWTPGEDFTILSISINPNDDPVAAMKAKQEAVQKLVNAGIAESDANEGWQFLTGRESDVAAIADAAGFGYRFVPRTGDYAHGAVLTFAAPDGQITRYLLGTRFVPFDYRMALTEASQGKRGSIMDAILQTCYQWDPQAGQFTVHAMTMMKIAGAVTVLTLFGVIGFLFYLERRRKIGPNANPPQSPHAPTAGSTGSSAGGAIQVS